MKLNVIAALALSFLLIHIHFTQATKKIKIKDKVDVFKKKILGNSKPKPKDPKHNGRGRYPQRGGFHRYPAPGSPYAGGSAGYGGYPGGYLNHNPNNRVLSPRYGGSFGYGGRGVRGGSPYSQSVQAMGAYPSDESRGFGPGAVKGAAGGAMAGMALGYGLGRFPRPHFSFHSPREEYYYNHYMYRKYGVKSTDTNDYSRDYKYTQPPMTYDSFMQSCMKRDDLLSGQIRNSNKEDLTFTLTNTTTAADINTGSDTAKSDRTAAGISSTSAPSTLHSMNESESSPVQTLRKASAEDDDDDDDDDDDTVSIVVIGYPALITDLKVRRCIGLYMAYCGKYLTRQREAAEPGAAPRPESLRGLIAVATGAALTLLNSNVLIQLH